MKIKSFEISGFRGIRKNIRIDLSSYSSVLLYGDNGCGKSSVADAFEWFYNDKIEHLSSEEIGQKGVPALRNIFLSDNEEASVTLNYSDSRYDCKKNLFYKKSKLASEQSNSSQDVKDYLNASLKENLILRYKDLLSFILSTKAQKLEEISQIIGFSEVSKVKGVLRKAVNDLKKELKIKNYYNHISIKQAQILEQIGQNIIDDKQYLNAIKNLIAPLNLSVEIKDDVSIDKLLALLEKPEDKEALELQLSYGKAIENLINFKAFFDNIYSAYKFFYEKCQQIIKDQDKLKKINLEPLLTQGISILEKRLYENDSCPLCLQDKSREELIDELRKRLEELALVKREKDAALDEKNTTQRLFQGALTEIENALKEKSLYLEENSDLRKKVEQIKKIISTASEKIRKTDLLEIDQISSPESFINLDAITLQSIISALGDKKAKIITGKKDDLSFTAYSKIFAVRQSYNEIKLLKKESEILTKQQTSMEVIYDEFTKKQREGLCSFLESISRDINDLYLFMNDSENVSEIELIPLDEDDEFAGITLQFKFHGKQESPPHKYLSESHLNCLGICLFLASVKTFNKLNKFIILDDVISSFDTNHRARFARLLVEKFSDYQIFLLTHEKDWFELVSNMVKGKSWLIKKVKWDHIDGASIEEPLTDIKARIEIKIKNSEPSELGNMIRKYLERLLKDICVNLEVKVRFLFNELNENRMVNELLSELKCKLKDRKCELKERPVFNKLNDSLFVANKTSHDSTFSEHIEDLKMFYDDVIELEGLFKCPQCNKFISKKHYDVVENIVKCSCGNFKCNWVK
ncbi:MAG: AAA family ATPase [Candidatus Schekmanbacteria bacterium]|nr:AAA family ATPase [Candidatus Schekmanbacteria bacterium]